MVYMRFLPFVNLVIFVLIIVSIVLITFTLSQKAPVVEPPVMLEKQLPKRPFEVVPSLDALALKWVEPTLQLPNLAEHLLYHGIVQRPDVQMSHPQFHFSFRGGTLCCAESGVPIYLTYQGHYLPVSAPTNLWLEMTPKGKTLDVVVHMNDGNGEIVTPAAHRHFTCSLQECAKPLVAWELGDYRVDSTLLIRQKTRWVGQDCFLQQHGGEAYAYVADRERIDFNIDEGIYSCFVKAGDFLVWKENRWQEARESTLGLPLLVVKHIEERMIQLELWDATGVSKTPLNLIKARDLGGIPNLAEEFRFVGAKTWAQFIVESRSGRLLLRARDWLVLTTEGWIKLDSPQKIDDYVSQKLVGPLLILEKMGRQQGKQVLTGHLYNSTRSERTAVAVNAEFLQCEGEKPKTQNIIQGSLQ